MIANMHPDPSNNNNPGIFQSVSNFISEKAEVLGDWISGHNNNQQSAPVPPPAPPASFTTLPGSTPQAVPPTSSVSPTAPPAPPVNNSDSSSIHITSNNTSSSGSNTWQESNIKAQEHGLNAEIHKNARQFQATRAQNETLPLMERTKAAGQAVMEGASEMAEGGKREFHETKAENAQQKMVSNTGPVDVSATAKAFDKKHEAQIKAHESSNNEEQHKQERLAHMENAKDENQPLMERAKSVGVALKEGAMELMEGSKREWNSKQVERASNNAQL